MTELEQGAVLAPEPTPADDGRTPLDGQREWRDLLLAGVGIAAGALAGGLPAPVAIPLGVAAIMLIPGYALIAVVFPTDEQIDFPERMALSLGAALGVVIMQALILDYLPGGVAPGPIRTMVTATTLALLAAAAVRRSRYTGGVRIWGGRRGAPTRPTPVVRFTQAMVIANILVAGFAYVMAVSGDPAPPTEFYVLGRDGHLDSYPRDVLPGQQIALRVGVGQSANNGDRYRVTARRAGVVVATLGPVALSPGQRWEDDLRIAAGEAGLEQELVLDLEREGETEPFRTLRLWLTTRQTAAGG